MRAHSCCEKVSLVVVVVAHNCCRHRCFTQDLTVTTVDLGVSDMSECFYKGNNNSYYSTTAAIIFVTAISAAEGTFSNASLPVASPDFLKYRSVQLRTSKT